MNNWLPVIGFIIVIVVSLGIIAIPKHKKLKMLRKKYPGYPKGYWISQGVGIGVSIGTGLGVALHNIAFGVALGAAIGTSIGSGLERKHKDEIRPVTKEEKKLKIQTVLSIIGAFILGLIVFFILRSIVK